MSRLLVLALVFVAACRLRFDARDDAAGLDGAAIDPILERCGPGVLVCDDFESDTFQPWDTLAGGGTIEVQPACGTSGSRCAHANCTIARTNIRFGFSPIPMFSRLSIDAVVIPRSVGDAQLLAFDVIDGATLVTQVGVQIYGGIVNVYEYSFASATVTGRSSSLIAATVDVPLTISLSVDLPTRAATLVVNGGAPMALTLSSTFSSASGGALIGLWCDVSGQSYDFDDVVVR